MIAVALLAGVAGGIVAWFLLRDVLRHERFVRTNRRGASIATASGLVVIVAVVVVEAAIVALDRLGPSLTAATGPGRQATVSAVLGFGLAGLLDDLVGDRDVKGFRGHLRSARAGRPSTGAVKLAVGGLVAVLVAVPLTTGAIDLLVVALLVALSANAGNLFDLAPARLAKVVLLVVAGAVVATLPADAAFGPVVVLGALVVVTVPELRESVMLGDTGANLAGAVGGVALAVVLDDTGRAVALVLVVALNAGAELVSFSRVIDATPPLRFLDRLGRRET